MIARLPHREQTSRARQFRTLVSSPYRLACSAGSGSTWWPQSPHHTMMRTLAAPAALRVIGGLGGDLVRPPLLAASSRGGCPWRSIPFRRWWRWRADRFRPDLRYDGFQCSNAGRERIPVANDDPVELGQQQGGLLVRKVKVHEPKVGALTSAIESRSVMLGCEWR